MKVIKQKYHDDKFGEEGDIVSVTNYIQNMDDVFCILEDLVDRFNKGWHDFKVEKINGTNAMVFEKYIVLHFRHRQEWKYLKIGLDLESSKNKP